MKLISQIIIISALVTNMACSKEETKTQPEPAKSAAAEVIKTETISINNAKKALDDSKQVSQAIQDSAAEQRETIEKTQQ
jgi:hypothetical protein